MSLIRCPDCGKEFSDAASACPTCGRPNKSAPAPAKKTGCLTQGCLVVVILGVVGAIIGGNGNPKNGAATPDVPPVHRISKFEARNDIRRLLKDPESAQFQNEVERTGPKAAVCGQVNSKNGFGGYGGFELYLVTDSTAAVFSADKGGDRFMRLWKKYCE